MAEYKHPMRDLEVIVYQKITEGTGPLFIAKYEPFQVHPIFFQGSSEEEVRKKAKDFADEAVAKHEQTYIARRANMEKARAARSKSKTVDESARSL